MAAVMSNINAELGHCVCGSGSDEHAQPCRIRILPLPVISRFSRRAGCRLAQASAGEADEIRPVETDQSPAPKPSSAPAADDDICNVLAAAATENDLPIDFLTRLIWQESRFDPAAVSRAGAQGVAQFMPAT